MIESAQPNWEAARRQMILDPDVIMLNTGSFGPTPRPVFDRVTELRRQFAAGPTNFFIRTMPPLLWHARERLAAYFKMAPTRLVLSANVSCAINLVASGLRLSAPGEILMTDHEYGSMQWCWERAAQRQGLTVRFVKIPQHPSTPSEMVEPIVNALSAKTRLLFFSHVVASTGMILPAREICAEARRRGVLTVVDGAHAPGMIDLNLPEIGADFYAGNCHKWMLAAIGTGFLAIADGNEDRLQPLHVSWGYHRDQYPIGAQQQTPGPDDRDVYGSTPRIRFLEFEATRDLCPWLALPETIDFQDLLGWDAVRARMKELSATTRDRVAGTLGFTEATPRHPDMHAAMTAFNLPAEINVPWLRDELWKRKIEVIINERPDRNILRISHHFYTRESEIDAWITAMQEILGE